MHTAHALSRLTHDALAAIMRDAPPVAARDLAGHAYRGLAVGLPRALEPLVQKFEKHFAPIDGEGRVRAWNQRMRQNGPDAPWIPATVAGRPLTYGRFTVRPVADYPAFAVEHPTALVFDYGQGEPPWSPFCVVRDVVVAANPGSADLLVGRMYLSAAGRTADARSFFLLMRDRPVTRTHP
ncbi:MAG: hypothetical protein KC635_21095 [Myxococcales bacterium]|nr:hypothetical protein [Myxococcales bacterium]MCB9731711.1 hypothetical protein [Deltaproteobacteria bacterium]